MVVLFKLGKNKIWKELKESHLSKYISFKMLHQVKYKIVTILLESLIHFQHICKQCVWNCLLFSVFWIIHWKLFINFKRNGKKFLDLKPLPLQIVSLCYFYIRNYAFHQPIWFFLQCPEEFCFLYVMRWITRSNHTARWFPTQPWQWSLNLR